ITRAYNFSQFSDGFVEVLAAQQTPESPSWFQGTADAVRKYLWLFESWDVDEVIILSGDHLYRMDYGLFVDHHRATGADITLSVVPVDYKVASSFGLMKIDGTGRIIDFNEKPKGDALESMKVDTTTLGLNPEEAKEKPFIASMGIYVFKKQALIDLLRRSPEQTDFGKEIIPGSAREYNVQAYLFDGYWEDIGTIEAFFNANLALTQQPHPPFSFYDEEAPIYTRARYLPPSKVLNSHVTESIIGDGCILKECRISRTVIGLRQRVGANCDIENALLMGADYYESSSESQQHLTRGKIPVGIGDSTIIRNAIIDKNARIGSNVKIVNKENIQEAEREDLGFYIRSGIVVVLKNAVIPDGMII
ncbi:MAG: glucose-1-phosphate adenylyltransferase, partial [Cyanobacteria bacterium P01_D01_bin.56]